MFSWQISSKFMSYGNYRGALYVPICGKNLAKESSASALKVLVVDDDPDLADVAGELLRAHGLDALIVYSAGEALELLEHDSEIDAIFSDVVMPEMTGLQLAKIVQAKFSKVKIVLVSGYAKPEVMSQVEGTYLFLPKPYKIDKVIELLSLERS